MVLDRWSATLYDPDIVSRTLRKRLSDVGLTGAALAEILGVDASAVSHKLAGRRPWRLEEARKIVEVLRARGSEASVESVFFPRSRRAA